MQHLFKQTWARLTAYFLTGVFAVLPLVITFGIVAWVASFISPKTPIGKALMSLGMRVSEANLEEGDPTWLPMLIGVIVVVAALFGLGFLLVELGIRKWLGRLVDAVASRIPIIGQVYGTSKQLVDMLDQSDQDKLKGMAPVFCQFGDQGGAGVLALLVSPESFEVNGRMYQIVIVPTAPVPFGGGLMFVPTENVYPAGMTVDGLMSIYISMGVTAPQFLPTGGTPPIDHLAGSS